VNIMKIWAIDVSVDLKHCDATVIKSKEKIQEYVIQLCKKLNIERHGDCAIAQFNNHERNTIQMHQMGQFALIAGYFIVDHCVGHIAIFSECPFDITTLLDFTQQFFDTDETSVDRNTKFIE